MIVRREDFRTFTCVALLLLAAMMTLAACGGGSDTTTASNSASSSNTPAPRPKAPKPVSGTIASYDAASKALTVKEASGTTQAFTVVGTTRIVKSQKITAQQLDTMVAGDGVSVLVVGPLASANTYTAQEVVVYDGATLAPNANANRGGGVRPNATAAARPAANNRILIQKGKVQNNQLVGQTTAGQTVTANLSATTTLFQETVGVATDLQSGQTVTVNSGPAQGSGSMKARQILVGVVPTRGTAG